MFPGGGRGGFNPKKMNQMMKQLGIDIEEVEDVQEVIIRTADKEIVIDDASVSIMDAQGQRTYQITGEASERKLDTGPDPEDVELVMEQAGVDEETAVEALEAAEGEPAQAIMDLMED